jgi:hypothetical protein
MSETINQKVVNWARAQSGKQVGKGECWDLADRALRQAGAQSSADLGPMDDDADYVWGDEISDLKDVQPGDILQFRDFAVTTTVETETRYADGSSETSTTEETFTRPHHTAVVSEVKSGGLLKILEQNVAPAGKKVQLHNLNTKDVAPASKETQKQKAKVIVTTTIAVSGTIWACRPKK